MDNGQNGFGFNQSNGMQPQMNQNNNFINNGMQPQMNQNNNFVNNGMQLQMNQNNSFVNNNQSINSNNMKENLNLYLILGIAGNLLLVLALFLNYYVSSAGGKKEGFNFINDAVFGKMILILPIISILVIISDIIKEKFKIFEKLAEPSINIVLAISELYMIILYTVDFFALKGRVAKEYGASLSLHLGFGYYLYWIALIILFIVPFISEKLKK